MEQIREASRNDGCSAGHRDFLQRFAKINELLAAIRELPEAFSDYRVRLWEMGYDTRGMRGMGATESNVNKFRPELEPGRAQGDDLLDGEVFRGQAGPICRAGKPST
ncbi:MAG TPA: hypothetical protein GXX30_11365 [Firmicutes bacterium]|nr:hypothetical protein [Candidatus Fermentithermobacillaceae bacterium]